jgi:uncharacterized membrane protein YoaT (DUF817 family)
MSAPDKRRQYIIDFFYFGFRQAYACMFGGALIVAIVASKFLWTDSMPIARYDFLFCYAVAIQLVFLLLKLETLEEAKVILVFHLVGTAMELFKTHVGSWVYPEENLIRLGGVPLFSGFMYSAVGSYIARVWRIFDFRFDHYPSQHLTVMLCLAIYLNFFTHHYIVDLRYVIFGAIFLLYRRTWIHYRPNNIHYKMPLLLGFSLVALFLWIAENFGTFGSIWVYPSQLKSWHMVPIEKMGSWFMLMIISFVLVTLVHGSKTEHEKIIT